jgi:hypothetical protein
MANNIVPRPLWVRVFAKPGSRRQSVRAEAFMFCLMAPLALLICAMEATSDSVLGRTAFFVGVVLVPVTVLLAVGAFCALRWVDRNGAWE